LPVKANGQLLTKQGGFISRKSGSDTDFSAGSIAMGSASVLATQGSVSAVSAGAITGVGNASLRAGQNLSVDAGQGSLVLSPWQTSQLSAGQDLSLTARTGQLKLDGWGSSSDTVGTRVSLTARDMNLQGASVDLLGAALSARRDLRITATDGSVNISALENTPNQGGYANRYMQGADLNASRHLQITSAGHILSQGLKASAGGDLSMRAAASLDMAGTSNRIDRYDGFWTIRQRQVNTSTLSAGGAMALSAGSDMRLDAVRASAGGAMTVNALGNVQLDASQNWSDYNRTSYSTRRSWYGRKTTTTTHHFQEYFTTAPTELSAASISVKAGNELSTYGSRINSLSGRTELQAAGAANYFAVYDQSIVRDDSHKSSSFLGMRYSSSRSASSRVEDTPLVTRLQSEGEPTSRSGGDTLMQGTQVNAAWGSSIEAGVGERARADARIILEGVRTTVQQSRTAKSDYVVWQSMSGSGSTTQTMALPSFAGGGTFTAPGGISVQIPDGDFKSQITSLSSQPGMGYLNDLTTRKDVNWQAVKLANDQWNYSQQGLTPVGAALIGLAVAMATGGAGASLLGTTTTTVTTVGGVATSTAVTTLGSTTLAVNGVATVAGAMANAAFTSLAAQASITLINNKGDVGKTLKELGNSHTVKNMIIAAGVAGVTTYTADWGRTVLTETGNTVVTDWAKRSQAYMLNTAAKGVLTGANSSSDWWTVAGLGLAGEAYQYWAGRGADVRPGVDREKPDFKFDEEDGLYRVPRVLVNGVLREGKNLGHNEECFSIFRICHGTPISNAISALPGMNAFATLHDSWGEWMDKSAGVWNTATNIGSMPPSLLVNYGALLDQYRYINAKRK
jgi:filamentous hemagglutinin